MVLFATAVFLNELKYDLMLVERDVQAKSRVTPNGVPNSSFLAYRLPMEVFESSTRENTPALRNFDAKISYGRADAGKQ